MHDTLYEQGRRISRDKQLRVDKSTEQLDYERSKADLTFKPDISRLPLEPTTIMHANQRQTQPKQSKVKQVTKP